LSRHRALALAASARQFTDAMAIVSDEPDILVDAMRSGISEVLPTTVRLDAMDAVLARAHEFSVDLAGGSLGHSGDGAHGRVITVTAPKGGVGKTTLAFNLAVALGQLEQRTVLIDGSLQFGDLRALLKVPVDAPSIVDLPTDRVAESDLQDVLWRDPSGIDILLAPPRIEQAEMISARDIDKVLSLLRRVYGSIVIDMSSALSDINLGFLDLSDTIIEIVTYDSTTIHNTVSVADTFRMIGYPASKVRYLVNRSDSEGGIDPGDLERAIGRVPEHKVVSDGKLVVASNNDGVPFVLANPEAQISRDVMRLATEILAVHGLGRAAVAGKR
jgi:pilus assembly protein CpaE